jgi:hypothetical protein
MFLAVAVLLGTLNLTAPIADGSAPSAPKQTELERAAEQFKIESGAMGLRPGDSPADVKQSQSIHPVWHGRLFENFRNDLIDATPHEIRQRGGSHSLLQRNQFGFNVSGPLIVPHLLSQRRSTFFSLSYEGVREHISRTLLTTVPTDAQRLGDFSQVVDPSGNPLPMFDPNSTQANPAYDPAQTVSTSNLQYLRQQFADNRIPVSRLDPQAVASLALYPEPNTNAGPYFQNNYFVSSPATNTADGFLGKVDQQIDPRNRITFDFNLSTGALGSPQWFPTAANPGSPNQTFHNRHLALPYVFTLSPSTVNTATLTIDRREYLTQTAMGSPFPVYRLDSYIGFGTSSPYGHTARTVYTLDDAASTHRGSHYLSAVAEYQARQVNTFAPEFPDSYYHFSSGITSLPGIINTGDAFASFLLGSPDLAERTYTPQPSYFRNSAAYLSVQDRYELGKAFTITLAARLNRRTPRVEKYNRQSTVNPHVLNPADELPGALSFAGIDGIPAGLRPTSYSLDPSVSFAWSPGANMRTAIRGSFARTHVAVPLYSSQWSTQGFTALQSIVSPNSQLSPAVDLTLGIPPLPFSLPNKQPAAANGGVADWLDLTSREPVYQSASLTVERQLPFSLIVSAGAYYNGGHDLLVGDSSANPNAINPNALVYGNALYTESFAATLRPFPNYTTFALSGLYPIGRYQRDAGFLRAEKRASNGLSVSAYYEYGKQFDDYSGPYGIQDFFNRNNDWAQTYGVPRQSVQLSYVYDIPVGNGKSGLNLSGWQQAIVGNWSVSGRVYADSGYPLAIHPEYNNTGGIISGLTVNSVPGVSPVVSNPSPNLWFNPAAFIQPPDFTLGDSPRTLASVLGPGVHSFDATLVKRVETGRDTTLEFTTTAFNVFNHADWDTPDTAIGSAAAPNTNAGHIIGSHGGRVIQLGLTFNF